MNKRILSLVIVSGLVTQVSLSETLKEVKHSRISTQNNMSMAKQSNPDSKFKGSFKVGLSGEKLEDEISQGTATTFSASLKIDYDLVKSLHFYGEPKLKFSQGQAQSLYGEFEPTNTISIDEALIIFSPHEFVDLSAGILSHRADKRVGNSYLMDGQPFPGVEAVIHILNFENFKTNLHLEESLPTSYTLDSGVEQREQSPRFHVQSLGFDYGKKGDFFTVSLFATKFEYENLPSVVAQKSISRGNTVTDGYHFDYGYAGYSVSTKTSLELFSLMRLKANGSYLVNNKAPSGLNQGQSLGGGVDFYLSDDVTLTSNLEKFYNEPDTTPAYYSTYKLGTNNRQGYIYELGLEFPNYNFKLQTGYMESDLVYKSGLMAKRSGILIKLETFDVTF